MATQPAKKQKLDKATEDNGAENEVYQKLDQVQEKLDKINEELSEEWLKLEKKYNEKKVPLYKERSEHLKKIPGFWKKVFLNHDVLVDCLSEDDLKVFDYLTDMSVDDLTSGEGYRITFKFKTNPWFKNAALWKEFKVTEEGTQVKVSDTEWVSGKIPFENKESFFVIWFQKEQDPEQALEDEVAEIIKDEIWSDPIRYYHGLPSAEGLEGEEEGEEEEEEDQ